MSVAANRHRNQLSSQHTRTKTPDSPSRATPRSNTPSRSRTQSFEPQPRGGNMDSPTPTPRKRPPRRKGARRADQREQEESAEGQAAPPEPEPSSDEELMHLLGVEPPARKSATSFSAALPADTANLADTPAPNGGVLPISKEDIKAAGPKGRRENKDRPVQAQAQDVARPPALRSTKKSGNGQKSHPVEKGFALDGVEVERVNNAFKVKNNRRNQPRPRNGNDDSAVVASFANANSTAGHASQDRSMFQPIAQHPNNIALHRDLVPFDVSALSKSLPSQNAGHMGPASDFSAKKQTPGGADKQELTWQQKLQQASVPANNKPARQTSERKPRKAAPSAFAGQPSSGKPSRPEHTRRASTDGFSIPVPPKTAPPNQSYAFDMPYTSGFNANRAPQTPSKDAVKPIPINTPLPVIPGEFPRIGKNKAFDNVLGPRSSTGSTTSTTIPRYAGPTSHSSPHAASLAKPGLEDF